MSGSRDRLYGIWKNMKNRCTYTSDRSYKNYGGRGIKVCDEWMNDFQAFYDWAMENSYRDDLTIDRIDVNGNYCPENCRWATRKEQSSNTRRNRFITYNGETHTVTQWAEIKGINAVTLFQRLQKGWDVEKALTNKMYAYELDTDENEKRYSIGEFAKMIGVTHRTLARWDVKGVLVAYRTPAGHRYYTDEHLEEFNKGKKEIRKKG